MPAQHTETVHMTVRVPVELARAFQCVARAEDRSVSAELRRLMRCHIEHFRRRQGAEPGETEPSKG